MKTLALTVVLTLWGASAPAQAQTANRTAAAGLGKPDGATNVDANIRAYIELLRTDIKGAKSQVMAEVMQLDADQAAKFWPVYKDFQTEFTALGDQVLKLIRDYAENFDKMTDPTADRLGKGVLGIEQQRHDLKAKYFDRMKTAVGAIVAARFLQVENQLERLIDLQIAAELPVVSASR